MHYHQSWMLHRIDPEQNVRRYYYIGLGRKLLDRKGMISVYRLYGRMGGTQQKTVPKQFDDLDKAQAFVQKLIDQKVKRGYELVSGESIL